MLIYDSHCHLAALSNDLRTYKIAVPAIRLADNSALLEYRRVNPQAKIGCGIHPWYLEDCNPADSDPATIKQQLRHQIIKSNPDFIGETGLDALKPNFARQLQLMEIHLELALEFNLPLVVHCVRAYNQLLSILKRFPKSRGVVHAYNANHHCATQLWRKNFFLGIGSIILNPNSQLAKAAAQLPLEQLLLESDAPYMPAVAKSPATSSVCLIYAQRLAQLQQKSLRSIIAEANHNWERLFNPRFSGI